ncbi:DNA polymerase III subunit chi [Bartonella tamiae]|uniref:DNA polymerase III subunit chi n=1 Tax=Bartonella tamiae TaxID=373638 RepID=UPI0018C8CBF8|nr:DNA polymerase III subunit chi [Bartonella tamiae]
MTEILFYHLTRSTLDEALPGLVERSLQRGWKASIQCLSEERCTHLDNHLWAYSEDSFIGHGTHNDCDHDLQPVYLTTREDNPNHSTVRFLLEGAFCTNVDKYQRLVVMFEGDDHDLVRLTREHWKHYRDQNHTLTYWQQTENGRWEKKT